VIFPCYAVPVLRPEFSSPCYIEGGGYTVVDSLLDSPLFPLLVYWLTYSVVYAVLTHAFA